MADSHESALDSFPLEESTVMALVEGTLFISGDKPVMKWQMVKGLGQTGERIANALAALAREYEKPEHALKIQSVAGGYRLTTKPEYYDRVKHLLQAPKTRTEFSPAAIEALALIALKQPIGLEQINDIRGVDSSGAIATLLKRKVIAYVQPALWNGRHIKPILFRTTRQFLLQFGLNSVDELPSAKRFAGLLSWRAECGAVEAEQGQLVAHNEI